MARIKEEDLRLNIIINSDGKTKLSQLEKQTKMNTMSLSELQKHLKLTSAALSKAVPGTQNWKNLQAEVQRTRERLNELKIGGDSVSSSINKFINGVGGKFALASLAVQGFNALLNLGKKAIEDAKTQTQAFGDQWAITIAGVNAGWQQLIANITTGGNVIKGSVGAAIRAGREAAAMTDELFERRNSLAIEEQKAATFIAEQNAVAMDSSRPAKERMVALDEVMKKEEELATSRRDIAKQELDAARLLLQQRTHLNDTALKAVVDEYEKNRDIITQANDYNALLDKKASLQKSIRRLSAMDENGLQSATIGSMERQMTELGRQIDATSQDIVSMAANVRQYNLGNDELVKAYVEGVKKVEEADTALATAQQGQSRRRGALNNQIASEEKAAMEKRYGEEMMLITASGNRELLEIRKNLANRIISEQEYKDRSEQLEAELLARKIELNRKYGKDTTELENELQSKILEGEMAAQQLREKAATFIASLETDKIAISRNAEQMRYENDLAEFEKFKSSLEDQAKVKEDIEAKHRRNMLKIDNDAELEKIRLQDEAHKTEIANIRNAHMTGIITMRQGSYAQAKAMRAMQMEIAASELAYLEQYLSQLEDIVGKQTDDDEIRKTKQQIAQVKSDIIDAQKTLKEGTDEGAFSGTGDGSLFGVSQRQWEQFFDNLKRGKLGADDLAAAISAAGDMANQAMELTRQAIDMTNAKEEQEYKSYQAINDGKRKDLEDRLRVGLITQAQYDRSLEDLQEEQDAKEQEMQRAQAERQKKAAVAQAIIQSALAVAKTFAQWGGWPFGVVPAAIMAALGAAQVAMIAATPTGYAEGGEVTRAQDGRKFNARLSPDKRGFISRPTILVGEEGGEYVIPADGLRNPSLAPFIGSIEAARRAGTLRSINFGAVSPTMSSIIPAMASGGPTSAFNAVPADYTAILEGMRELGRKWDSVRAVVPMLGKGGIVEALDQYDKIKNRGKL